MCKPAKAGEKAKHHEKENRLPQQQSNSVAIDERHFSDSFN
jgi:hypothetical protein